MSEIRACVSERILQTVDRMFTGNVSGRITEILQNSRRAGAKNVLIDQRPANKDECIITVSDDGHGIADFATLLNAGKTDWNQETQQSEDPAGMGLFCLAPRTLTITSNGKTACIEGDGWRGAPVKVLECANGGPGTTLEFKDARWDTHVVERCSRFSGLTVHLSKYTIHSKDFIDPSKPSTHIPELGVIIQADTRQKRWVEACSPPYYSFDFTFLNFHGQVVYAKLDALMGGSPILQSSNDMGLGIGVHLTGEPTDLRLILPARTGIVMNKAAERLGKECEKEMYRWVQRKRHHTLSYANFQRAAEIGVPIPEAECSVSRPFYECDTFNGNFRHPETTDPIVTSDTKFIIRSIDGENDPDDEDMGRCNLILKSMNLDNAPIGRVSEKHHGYSWVDDFVKLEKVTVEYGEEMFSGEIRGSSIVCVPEIAYRAEFNDGSVKEGKLWVSPSADGEEVESQWDSTIIITPDTIDKGPDYFVWASIGGRDEEIDWDVDSRAFEEEYQDFTDQLIGPDEATRRRIHDGVFSQLWGMDRDEVKRVEVDKDGNVLIIYDVDRVRKLSVRKG